jgi:hypothetical protein
MKKTLMRFKNKIVPWRFAKTLQYTWSEPEDAFNCRVNTPLEPGQSKREGWRQAFTAESIK